MSFKKISKDQPEKFEFSSENLATANNIILNSFNGLLKSKVYDKPSSLQTLNNDFEYLEPFNFELQQNVLYSGNVTVDSGLFEFEFVVRSSYFAVCSS